MHVMGVSKGKKHICVTRCCFCENCKVTNSCACSLKLKPMENCEKFHAVASVSERVNELFVKLPDGYDCKSFDLLHG